jgi:DNA-binding MarR family transcriptional regulator
MDRNKMVGRTKRSSDSFGTFLKTTQRRTRAPAPDQRVLRELVSGKPVEFIEIVKRTKLRPSVVVDILRDADFAGLIKMETGQAGDRSAKITPAGKKLLTELPETE